MSPMHVKTKQVTHLPIEPRAKNKKKVTIPLKAHVKSVFSQPGSTQTVGQNGAGESVINQVLGDNEILKKRGGPVLMDPGECGRFWGGYFLGLHQHNRAIGGKGGRTGCTF